MGFDQSADEGMADFVISDQSLAAAIREWLTLHAGNDSIHCSIDFRKPDGIFAASGRENRGFIEKVGQISASEAWGPSGNALKGKTLFKDDIEIWLALILHHQRPSDYSEWRRVIVSHWERGVEELSEIASREGDWIRTLQSCLPG